MKSPQPLLSLLILILAIGACSSSQKLNIEPKEYLEETELTDAHISSIQLGIEFHELGDFDRARKEYFSILRESPNAPSVFYQIAYAYSDEGNFDHCIEYANRGAKIRSEDRYLLLHLLGVCLDNAGRIKEAKNALEMGIFENPNYPPLYYSIAITEIKTDRYAQARRYLEESIENDPTYPGIHILLGWIHELQNSPFAAFMAYNYSLLFEFDTPRSIDVRHSIKNLMVPDVTYGEDGRANVSLNLNILTGFGDVSNSANLMFSLAMVRAIRSFDEETTEMQRLVATIEAIFSMSSTMLEKESAKGVIWDRYASFFVELHEAGHTEAYVYVIFEDLELEGIKEWKDENGEKLADFYDWVDEILTRDFATEETS